MQYIVPEEAREFLKAKDARMRRLILYGQAPREYIIEDAFKALVDIIVGQQISEKAKAAILSRVKAAFPTMDQRTFESLAEEDLTALGLSRMKASTIIRLAKSDEDFNALKQEDKRTVKKKLTAFKGIGMWTVEMFYFIAMQDEDVLSLRDMGIRNALKTLYDCSDKDLPAFKPYFSPHGSAASAYLWTMLALDDETIQTIKGA